MPELIPDPTDDNPPAYTPTETYQSLACMAMQVTSLEGLKTIVNLLCKRVEVVENRATVLEDRVTALEA